MKALVVEPARYDDEARRTLEAAAAVVYVECPTQDAFQRALAAAPYDAVFVRLGLAMNREALGAGERLRWIVTPTTGLDHIDTEAAARRGIQVISLRGEQAFLETVRSTAEHAWALLLALTRRLRAAQRDVAAGRWARDGLVCDELHGRTLGIVGCGRLGRMVAGYALAFGMRVLAHDRSADAIARAPEGVVSAELPRLLAESDVVSLHLPLTDETERFLSAERLRAMKAGAILINTARGELVDEAALLAALTSGQIAAAGLDVLAGDSRWDGGAPAEHPLIAFARTHEQLLITPHVGGYGESSIVRTRRFVARRFAEAVRGGA